jgi:predicted kinase
MARVILLVGIPCSGKSTHAVGLGYPVVSSGRIREEITGSRRDTRREEDVWRIFWQRVGDNLRRGKDVVLDSTNTDPLHREKAVARCYELGAAEVVAYWLDVPLRTCLWRNERRDEPIPEAEIRKMHARLVASPPTTSPGGFTQVTRTGL